VGRVACLIVGMAGSCVVFTGTPIGHAQTSDGFAREAVLRGRVEVVSSRASSSARLVDASLLVDSSRETIVELSGPDTLSITLSGPPLWMDRVQLDTDAKRLGVEVLDARRGWLSTVELPASDGSRHYALNPTRATSLRLIGDSRAGRFHIAGVTLSFVAADPDGGTGPSYYAEYVDKYQARCLQGDLSNCGKNVRGLGDMLPAAFAKTYWGNESCWARDWLPPAEGGWDNDYPDARDLAIFDGHGSAACLSFCPSTCAPGGGCRNADKEFLASNVISLGDRQLEWLVATGCASFARLSWPLWAKTMRGLHMAMGCQQSAPDKLISDRFGKYMVKRANDGWAWPIAIAFIHAIDEQTWSYPAVVAEEETFFDEYLWTQGNVLADPVHDAWYYWLAILPPPDPPELIARAMGSSWLRIPPTSAKGVVVRVDPALVDQPGPGTMPVYRTIVPTVDSALVQSIADQMCAHLGVLCSGTVGSTEPDDSEFGKYDGTHGLRVAVESSAMSYIDESQWLRMRSSAPILPSASVATAIADSILNLLGRRRADAEVLRVDELWQGRAQGTAPYADDPALTYPTNRRVVYRRRIDSGIVGGPGARLCVEVGEGGAIQRISEGGWRPISTLPEYDVAVPTLRSALDDIAAEGMDATIQGLQMSVDSLEISSASVGYYEEALGVVQEFLRPAFLLEGVAYGRGLTADSIFTLPVTIEIHAIGTQPRAAIVSGPAESVPPGTSVCLAASVLGGTPPFQMEWTDDQGAVLSTDSMFCAPLSPTANPRPGPDSTFSVRFAVIDANGKRSHSDFTVRFSPALSVESSAFGDLRLSGAQPNPFSDAISIHYVLPQRTRATLTVFSTAGRRIRTLSQGERAAGQHMVSWDGRDDSGTRVPAGVYWVRLKGVCCGSGMQDISRKIVIVR